MKKLYRLAILSCVVALVFPVVANAQSLTTLFAANNGGSFGGAVYFDVTVGANPLEVTSFETNTAETVPFGWTVYLTDPGVPGQPNVLIPGAWNLTATGTGTGMGVNVPSPVALDSTFSLAAGTSYGMMLVMGPEAGHDYTNGDGVSPPWGGGGNQTYANGDLTLDLGSASNAPWVPGEFQPRVWNGTINYRVVPEPSAGILVVLSGLGLAFFRRR